MAYICRGCGHPNFAGVCCLGADQEHVGGTPRGAPSPPRPATEKDDGAPLLVPNSEPEDSGGVMGALRREARSDNGVVAGILNAAEPGHYRWRSEPRAYTGSGA